ncbi:MAG: hypothetical protein ACYTAS_19865, partial [Planctomycetota bacterium]
MSTGRDRLPAGDMPLTVVCGKGTMKQRIRRRQNTESEFPSAERLTFGRRKAEKMKPIHVGLLCVLTVLVFPSLLAANVTAGDVL